MRNENFELKQLVVYNLVEKTNFKKIEKIILTCGLKMYPVQ
jgi:hypothetical protein